MANVGMAIRTTFYTLGEHDYELWLETYFAQEVDCKLPRLIQQIVKAFEQHAVILPSHEVLMAEHMAIKYQRTAGLRKSIDWM